MGVAPIVGLRDAPAAGPSTHRARDAMRRRLRDLPDHGAGRPLAVSLAFGHDSRTERES